MAFHRLDINGKPLPSKGKGRTNRKAAERMENGVTLFHYEITAAVKLPEGKMRQIRRRYWLSGDDKAEAKERELCRQTPKDALTWEDAYKRWLENNDFSEGHVKNTTTTMKQWYAAFGANSTIEGTSLAAFSAWMEERSKEGKGRGAQIKYGHLMAIAEWCRERGYVTEIPFEHSPKPEARLEEREPAQVEAFVAIMKALPDHVALVWELLGWTGMRLGAACGLLEVDIEATRFTVTTKGDKRVPYPVTAEIATIFRKAREWKAARGFNKVATIFCNEVGNPWNSTTIGRRFKKVSESMETGKVTAHQLRHMAGTVWGKKNFSADIIGAALGHGSRESSDRYVSKDLEMREMAMSALASFLQEKYMQNGLAAESDVYRKTAEDIIKLEIKCPKCGHNFFETINLKPQPV